MANRLKMGKVNAIKTLREKGWSERRIAETLGISRRTVARYLRGAVSKCTKAPTGSDDLEEDSKCTKAPAGSDGEVGVPEGQSSWGSSRSQCEPLRRVIEPKVEAGLSGQRIYQDLAIDHGFTGSYWSVRRFVRTLTVSDTVPFRRMECEPGAEVQVDFGTGAVVVTSDGRRRKTHVFRVVLSYSRKGYSEAVYRQTTDNFLLALENAFWHFGGVPRVVVIDNLKAAVSKADWYDPDIHPKIQSFAAHYGTTILPTKPRTPRHKGKVERGVGYVKGNALKGRTFSSLEQQNDHLLEWETTVADTRIHGTTKRQVGQFFEECERPALLPLPRERFPFFHEGRRSVNRDGHVEVDKSYYSAPPEYLGRYVWVRWDSRLVRLFNHRMEQIAIHVKKEPGRFSTDENHVRKEKISDIEKGATWMLSRAHQIGPHAGRWGAKVLKSRGIEGIRVLLGLIHLVHRYESQAIDQACQTALSYGADRLRTIRQLLKRDTPPEVQMTFLEEHPIIRSLADYSAIVKEALP